jgi:23S rRNA (cytosine1962-C5)-methyltransferase
MKRAESMETLPTVLLKPGEADRIVAGHPWVYHSSIIRLTQPAEDGGVVQVKDHRQRLLGIGLYNSKSKIHVRMLARERVAIDRAFFDQRIQAALEFRRKHLPQATSFRVVNAESDFLSGLIVDKYEDVLVIQTAARGMNDRKDLVLAALQQLFSPRAVVERNDAAFRKFEGMTECNGLLAGQLDGPVPVRFHGLEFEADPMAGHKTGLYLDQQENYRLVGELLARQGAREVLDCFCFQGAFALHAAQAGATAVLGIDQSAEAVAVARRLAAANGMEQRCQFEAANVFDWFKSATPPGTKTTPRFDAVVLDPPSFTRNRASVPDALRGYKEIHIRALRLIRTGGTLATFCCSHHVDGRTFLDVILSAAYDAHRVLRRTAIFSQSPDHPVVPSIPETEYLKGYAFEVV